MVGQGAENSVSREQLVVGDDNGVHGRLNERLCQAVTSCLQAQGHNRRCGDFKAGNSPAQIATARAPDIVVLNANAAIKVVGEVKTPWPQDLVERLSLAVEQFEAGDDDRLRHIPPSHVFWMLFWMLFHLIDGLHWPTVKTRNTGSPYPDVSDGLRRSQFVDYEPALHYLNHISSPISRTPNFVSPCFALEVKGDSGGMDAEIQSRHNTANMLFNLRQLSALSNGEEATHLSFDRILKACSATVTQQGMTIFCDWVEQNENT
ncbi:hypothetical protein PENPOL_c007G10820 [Penicillium polonicum]|uniref:Uncharacterized protein n=1 Tax=Penicillium polonicum TaxID=60169 RepID=A0A1V6NIJ7_PENPO|nr:hypothetical protein PENPOL_c007G10820 [Penicillium polonicum]